MAKGEHEIPTRNQQVSGHEVDYYGEAGSPVSQKSALGNKSVISSGSKVSGISKKSPTVVSQQKKSVVKTQGKMY